MSGTLLVVDFKNQVYRATATHLSLFSRRTFTGGLYGFLVTVLKAVRITQATRLVVATDSPPYIRKREFPEYKAGRKRAGDGDGGVDELVAKAELSVPLIKALLERMDVPFWAVPGFEYDDIAAYAADAFRSRFDSIIAMTNDSDLYQLFDHGNFSLYKGKGVLYTYDDFVSEFGPLSREEWVTVQSMTGTHNAVPGIDGIGPVTAVRTLKTPTKLAEVLRKHGATIERNRRLIELPHAQFPEHPGLRLRTHDFRMRDVLRWVGEYQIEAFPTMADALEQLRRG
jgi:5'-3' exonuclease